MGYNAAGLDVSGSGNPNWRGGVLTKSCEGCQQPFTVKPGRSAAKFCSLQCVGISQRKAVPQWTMAEKECSECSSLFYVPASHAHRYYCCSRACGGRRRSRLQAGEANANWNGGLSRLPYPWNFRDISRRIIHRDGYACQNPTCRGNDTRLTAHHINYDKTDCQDENLITLCSSCNSRANFGREHWQPLYTQLVAKKHGGGWNIEVFE